MFFKKKVTLLLDIDGVFNSLGKIDNPIIVKHDWGIWQLTKENAEFLKYLSKNCNCIWISNWGKEANQLNKFLGIKKFKTIFTGNKVVDVLQYMRKNLKNKSQILVIDDEELLIGEYQLRTNGDTGLTKEDRDIILEFIENQGHIIPECIVKI